MFKTLDFIPMEHFYDSYGALCTKCASIECMLQAKPDGTLTNYGLRLPTENCLWRRNYYYNFFLNLFKAWAHMYTSSQPYKFNHYILSVNTHIHFKTCISIMYFFFLTNTFFPGHKRGGNSRKTRSPSLLVQCEHHIYVQCIRSSTAVWTIGILSS